MAFAYGDCSTLDLLFAAQCQDFLLIADCVDVYRSISFALPCSMLSSLLMSML